VIGFDGKLSACAATIDASMQQAASIPGFIVTLVSSAAAIVP
jgi:hypothetical protein